jgi:Kef-type K+ transport system membrane component KefB
MLNELLAGILAGSGWLIGILLYRFTRDEIDPFLKKHNFTKIAFRNTLMMVLIFSLSLGLHEINQTNLLTVFVGSLFVSSIDSSNKKPKRQILFFIIHVMVFLAAYFAAQSF